MYITNSPRRLISAVLGLIIVMSGAVILGQKESKDKKDKQTLPDAPAVLWREPTDIASRDLFLGPGGEPMKPDLSHVTFIGLQRGGHTKNGRWTNGAGGGGVGKVGNRAQPE